MSKVLKPICIINNMNTSEIKVFSTIQEIAERIIQDLQKTAIQHEKKSSMLNIALSGGNTPEIVYRMLAQYPDHDQFPWSIIHFYWGDERCVKPSHPDSNYGMVYNSLIKYLPIPPENIHRIFGENDPDKEIKRYSELIRRNIQRRIDNIPQFDWIILGLGEDGHTASLFPDQPIVDEGNGICAYTINPVKGYKRITFTYQLINQSSRITFLVSGDSKSEILKKIIGKNLPKCNYPALKINPRYGRIEWFVDTAAARELTIGQGM